jgi:uncharacterized membrane protein YjdF
MKVKNFDVFIILNLVLFIFMCIFVYYDRFITYKGSENILEFYVYALFCILVILIIWIYFRKYEISLFALCLIELGILSHFAGGLMNINGKRLYDNVFFHIRYDKYVHFINSFIACMITRNVLFRFGFSIKRLEGFILIMIVLGMGAFIEIIEYLVVTTIPKAGVGGYDNNMQDLIANFLGGISYLTFRYFKKDKTNK